MSDVWGVLIGGGLVISGQTLAHFLGRHEGRKRSRDEFQRTTLLELQDGPVVAFATFVDGLADAVDEGRSDPSDGSDSAWEAFERVDRSARRLVSRVDDDGVRRQYEMLVRDTRDVLMTNCSHESLMTVYRSQQTLIDQIGEQLRKRS